MKYAHISENSKQSIKQHLEGVAELAAQYSNDMMRDYAYKTGLAHDIGKYADDFQKRLEKCGITVTIRREMGRDIDGACGQLRKRFSER